MAEARQAAQSNRPVAGAQPWYRSLLRSFAILLAIAVVGNLGLGVLFGYRSWRSYLVGFVPFLYFTFCIGGLCSLVLNWLWPITMHWPRWKAHLARIGALSACVTAGTLIGQTLMFWSGNIPVNNFWGAYVVNMKVSIFMTLTFGITTMVYEHYRARHEETQAELARAEQERQRALQLATEARLASLESRIHPHFLFNTLNTISALIHEDPVAADEQLQRFAKLLRFSLDAPEKGLVPLQQELQVVRDYLQIEQVRFGERLRFSIDVPAELLVAMVPPLSLQTLAENAVKYAVSPQRQGAAITIAASSTDTTLSCSVEDTGPGLPEQPFLPGHGLDLLRSRLQALFGTYASLQVRGAKVVMVTPIGGTIAATRLSAG